MRRAEILLAADRRGEELRYVTEHFRDLQGLRQVPGCAALLVFCLAAWWLNPGPRVAIGGLAAISVAGTLWFRWSGRGWYECRYGVVTEADATMMAPFSRFGEQTLILLDLDSPPSGVRYGPAPWKWWALAASILLFLAPVAWAPSMSSVSLPWQIERNICLYAAVFLLLPVCLFRVPPSPFIWLRRVLYTAAMLAMVAENAWWITRAGKTESADKWIEMASIAAVMLCVTAYDHWLLGHLLKPQKETA